jgi:osmotically-inducible protein OsmY
VDSRTTSVRVVTTSDHTVYLTGLISDQNLIKAAGAAATQAAPSYKIVNNIKSGFFDDPNHVNGGGQPK